MNKKFKKIAPPAVLFILLMGIISLLSDMTHEGAKSIYGSFLELTGASGSAISFVSGLGEFIGCSLILVTGAIANKTKKYWLMTIIGYAINVLAIPALALVGENGWLYACILIIIERVGRAIRKPAKNTLVSFASKEIGAGKSFALQEFMDQIGAFLGPVLLTAVLLITKNNSLLISYKWCFAFLLIPAIACLIMLFVALKKYPNPEKFEKDDSTVKTKFAMQKSFIFYIVAICLSAIGFIDFPLVTVYVGSLNLMDKMYLPLLYSLAMLVDAFSALFFGFLFDRIGIKVLMVSSVITSLFALFIFATAKLPLIIIGIILWGIGMGAQESILKSAITTIVPKTNRSIGFGIFEMFFGLFWFLGSWLIGVLYDTSIIAMIIVSVAAQLLSVPFYFITSKSINKQKD